MKLIHRFAAPSLSLSVLGIMAALPLEQACSSSTNATSKGDAGTQHEAGASGPLGFAPSNISLSGIDLSMIADVDVSSECDVSTDTSPTPGGSCLQNAAESIVAQSDGSKIHVFVVKSLTVEPAGHIWVNGPAGGLPIAIVSLGNMTILGPVDVHAAGDQAYGGGFESTQNSQKGAGPGGGPAATGVANTTLGAGAGGGSYCGQGGQGALEAMATALAGPATAAYGTAAIVPLVGGSTGGAGTFGSGAGGGALQLVAGSQFSLGAGGYVNAGGGGGQPAVSSNSGDNSAGGGSGGSILIEAITVQIAGTLAANGGGGGGVGAAGKDGTPDGVLAAGGVQTGVAAGGAGGAAACVEGVTRAVAEPGRAGGGGGGVGRIRINSLAGSASIASTATFSPAVTTACVTQGHLN